MRREEITTELENASFGYFYWFSRFEFALKENGFLKSTEEGANAEPCWEGFKERYADDYTLSQDANKLLELHPKRQIVNGNQELDWRPVGIDHCNNELCKIVTMLNTVRNNLFHGGKHGDMDMDNIERNIQLLYVSKLVLDQLAEFAGFDADYTRYY